MDDSLFFPLSVALASLQVELKFRRGFPFSNASCTCCNKEIRSKEKNRVVLTSVTCLNEALGKVKYFEPEKKECSSYRCANKSESSSRTWNEMKEEGGNMIC